MNSAPCFAFLPVPKILPQVPENSPKQDYGKSWSICKLDMLRIECVMISWYTLVYCTSCDPQIESVSIVLSSWARHFTLIVSHST